MGMLGNRQEVVRGYRRSLESLEKVIDPCQEQAVSSRRCLATGLADLRRNAEAQRVLDQGWELCKRSPEKSSAASLRSQLGLLFLAEGHSRPALRTLEDALRLHDEAKTPEGNLGFTLHGLGSASLQLGRVDQALVYLERALAGRPPPKVIEPYPSADISFTLARALFARRKDHPRACALAREALDGYRPLPNRRSVIGEVERLLARQRCSPTS